MDLITPPLIARPIAFQAHYDNRRLSRFEDWNQDNHAVIVARWKAGEDCDLFEFARVQWEIQGWFTK